MAGIHHHAGNLIFREGDVGDTVAYILSGRVEILKRVGGQEVVLGEIGAGDYVGEMSILEGRPRGASVRAISEVQLRLLSPTEFTERLRSEPDTALQLIVRLSERLRSANERLAEQIVVNGKAPAVPAVAVVEKPAGQAAAPGTASLSNGTLRLFPDSPQTADALPSDGLLIEAIPFRVGRPVGRREKSASQPVDLKIPDKKPFRLSRSHFSIVRDREGYAVRDVRSHLGTVVNGELIGQNAPRTMATLVAGENLVVAGGKDSPFAFRLVYEAS